MTNKQAAIKIIQTLREKGYQALLAGGCVRDMILERQAKDHDVATDAKPEDVIALFARTIQVGAQFGVVIVLMNDQQVEVATFRAEADYVDGRHPQTVHFTSPAKDAARRDFTINGMFYDPEKNQIIDYVNGQTDLEKKIIRTIGLPAERFGEDYLRMLRAVRFATQLDFVIEQQTWNAVCDNSQNITKISGERIAIELQAILCDQRKAAGVKMLVDSKLFEFIFPGFTGEKIQLGLSVLENLPGTIDFAIGLAALFAGFESRAALEKCEILKLSNSHAKKIKFLLDSRGKLLNPDMTLAELKLIAGEEYFEDLFTFQAAIQKAKGQSTDPLTAIRQRLIALGDVELRPKPLLDGHDLMRLGIKEGPMLGRAVRELYIAQLEGDIETIDQAKQWIVQWLNKQRGGTIG